MTGRLVCLLLLASACADAPLEGDGSIVDAALVDSSTLDSGKIDSGSPDAGTKDAGVRDAGGADTSVPDAGPLGPLSDAFEGTSLSNAWTIYMPSAFSIAVSGGELHLTATQNSVWYQSDTGPALFKDVTGNFKMTTSVRVRSVSQPTMPPPPEYQFGGLIARNASGAQENWVFAVLGERSGYIALESKTTVNGQSTLNAPEWSSEYADIRICRFGTTFLLLARQPGASGWITQGTHVRADLPATLQVGPIVYAYTNSPDIRASFDRVQIDAVTSLAQCTND